MDLFLTQRVIWIVGFIAEAALLASLVHKKLYRRYPVFGSYLAVQCAFSVALFQIDYTSVAYGNAYRWYAASMVVLRAGIVCELFERISGHFKNFGRFRFYMAGGIAVIAGLGAWAAFSPVGPEKSYVYTASVLVYRWEMLGAAIALILMRWFLYVFLGARPAISSNVEAHWKLTVIYFAIDAVWCFDELLSVSVRTRMIENVCVMLAETACIVAWIVVFSKAGELVIPLGRTYTDAQSTAIHSRDRELGNLTAMLRRDVGESLEP